MKLRAFFALIAAAAVLALTPVGAQAGDLERLHDCMFGWMHHHHDHAAKHHVRRHHRHARRHHPHQRIHARHIRAMRAK